MTDTQTRPDKPAQAEVPDQDSAESLTHLDTSFLIKALVPGTREDHRLRLWIREGGAISISSIARTEFLCGPVSDEDRQRARKIVGTPLPLVEGQAERAAKLFNVGGRRRGSFPDCLIAATALNAGARLATSNPGDFRRFERAELKPVSG